MLEPDRDQIELFTDAVFRHAGAAGFVSVRSFYEAGDKPFRLSSAPLSSGLNFLIDVAEDDARRAAQFPKPVVFCPPLAIFSSKDRAREQDLVAGLVLSVECDEGPQAAREILEQILGPATVVVKSGGRCSNGSDEPSDKLHLHYRLTRPAQGGDLAKLKQARDLACRLVGGDPSNKPVCHPIRWPGSWHRKAEPRLCEIEALDPDREIDLEVALAALIAAAPIAAAKPSAAGASAPPPGDWAKLIGDIISGQSFHASLASLAAWLVGSNVLDGSVVKLLRALMSASAAPHDARWQSRFDSIPRIVTSARDKFAEAAEPRPAEPGKPLLWPYEGQAFADIPRRRWLHAGHYIRGQVVMTVAPGGYGKTSLVLCNAIEMTTGRGLLGPAPMEALHVAYWNAEDPDEEITRRIAAACLQHAIDPAELRDRLFLGSRLTGKRRIAAVDRSGNVVFDTDMLGEIERLIGELKLGCVILDPLVAFHRFPEGDNTLMEQVIKDGFGELAARTEVCIELSQHTRKAGSGGRQGDLSADDSRGAGAIVNAARSVRVLNRMTAEEAKLPKIAPEERRHYLRVLRDKTNLAPPGKATWIRLVSVELPNGDGTKPGDQVQAVVSWDYPQPFDYVSADDMRWMRNTVREGEYRRDPRSHDWVGLPLAGRLNLDPEDPGDRKRLNAILAAWFANGVLATARRKDHTRHEREYVVPGAWNDTDETASVSEND